MRLGLTVGMILVLETRCVVVEGGGGGRRWQSNVIIYHLNPIHNNKSTT